MAANPFAQFAAKKGGPPPQKGDSPFPPKKGSLPPKKGNSSHKKPPVDIAKQGKALALQKVAQKYGVGGK